MPAARPGRRGTAAPGTAVDHRGLLAHQRAHLHVGAAGPELQHREAGQHRVADVLAVGVETAVALGQLEPLLRGERVTRAHRARGGPGGWRSPDGVRLDLRHDRHAPPPTRGRHGRMSA